MKERELDSWFDENRELPEIDDYARMRGWNWGDGGYQEKLKIYYIFNPLPDNENKDVMDYKPKLGQHSLEWAIYNKYYGTPEWQEARKNMIECLKWKK